MPRSRCPEVEAPIPRALVAAHVGEMKQVYTLLNQKDICMFACGRKFFCLMDLAAIIALLHDACMRDQAAVR